MDAIKFIETDIQRRTGRPFWVQAVFYSGIFGWPLVLGIFLRDGLDGVFAPRIFIPNLAAALLLGALSLRIYREGYSGQNLFVLTAVSLWIGLFLATERVFFPPGSRTTYPSSTLFWHESSKCFIKGGSATLIFGIWTLGFAFVTSSWPSRRWRVLIAAISGVAGAVMLGFHCDSSSFEHVLVGHVVPGILMGTLIFGFQEILFYRKLRKSFPALPEKLRHFHKLG